ncbi:MAG: SusC/RagA family TonB-linked outer membrane protein [Bacteroidota bacterium]
MKNNAYKYLIMLGKYTCYAYLFAVVLIHTAAAEASHAQGAVRVDEATVSLQIKNKTLLEAFRMLESKTRYSFIYNPDEMSNSTRITSQGGRRTVKTVLLEISQQANVSFRQVNNRISVKAHKGPNFDRHIDMIIEQQQIRGTVKDEDGQPLPGATVQEKGTTNGTITDANGQYTLSVSDDAVLIYSFVGYSTTEVPVDGQTVIDISLTFDTSTLGEVVVVGYGTQTRRDLTGSIVSVKPEEFTKGVNYDAVQLLNGAAAGVAVSQVSSAPGAELRIQIRGAGSINSSNQVLFVVDGLPGVNPQSLSPLDIESMEVLKDASAAAIYGTRAANGVVLITTKKGASGRTSLSYSAFAGIQSVTEQLDVLGARDYAELVNLRSPGTYTQDEINGFGGGTDWQDEIFRNAPVQNHQLSMSGGNEKSNYYVGINYFNQQGVVRRSASEKYNVRLNLRANPLENLVVSTNINYTRQSDDQILFSNAANENAGPINSAIQFDPTLPAGLDDNGRYFLNPSIALDNPVALIQWSGHQPTGQ